MAKSKDDNTEKKPVDAAMQRRLANLIPFKKGQSGNPAGRRKGQRDYRTLFWIALEHIANQHGLEPEQVEEALIASGIVKAIKGDFFFHQDTLNRVYGKAMDRMDVTSGGKTLAELINAANAKPKPRGKTKG